MIGIIQPALVAIMVHAMVLAPPAATLSFDGTDYFHRWSKNGQHEFTPKGDEDLAAWKTMITINVHDGTRNGDQLADLANRVLTNYQGAGKILRTDSTVRTKDKEAEHFVAAVLGTPQFLEAVLARFALVEGRGVVMVYSKRIYGAKAGDAMSQWLDANAVGLERRLRSWDGLPAMAALNALPESAKE
jgi:hypothetical protein